MIRGIYCALASFIAAHIFLAPAVLAEEDNYKLLKLQGHFARWSPIQSSETTVVTYAFANKIVHSKDARNCGAMQPMGKALDHSRISMRQFREEFTKATRMWEEAANIRFVEAATPQVANILIGAQVRGIGRAFTNVELAADRVSPGTRQIKRSLICLNPDMPWKVGFDGDLAAYDLRYTLAHELGHAIGLDHPSERGSLMFYKYDETQHDLAVGDMAGAALIYGAGPKFAKAKAETLTPTTELADTNSDGTEKADEPSSRRSSFGLGGKP
ncbi:Matrixin [Filomicrobium insigne]|uniref:Matrixin n=1 Tax=Filomicrobium insigne TaxID=418854 RepID=A0A1H0J5S2_9HYPH|nr:matrixin family metalloprotease [Filomicrobium insigne]SDO39128.1 Matrixin [Filomicrobium insigne]